ncbi:MAG: polysaccharide biosynthesis/export family protein [Tannerellaceae bacterium]|jgi:polysaccharide export outer membrane protein|nr:polysaccharide biosynthesis/export family protein [Tannerellaceae bacterium]
MTTNLKFVPALFGLLLLAASCAAPKDVVYFQNIDALAEQQKALMNHSYSSRIAPDDILSIIVTSQSPEVATPFNPPLYTYTIPQQERVVNNSSGIPMPTAQLSNSSELTSYQVNSDGDIKFPVLGRFHVAGFSKQEVENRLQEEIRRYVPDAIVHVRVQNFKVSVMGDVLQPGIVPVQNERITILEALARAGDMTINGSRTNVLVIRDYNGEKEYGRIDLSSPDVFSSPYYYLRQNDIVYVEPNKARQKSARSSAGENLTIMTFSAVISAISAASTIILTISNLRR